MSKSYMVSSVMDQKKTAVGIYKHKIQGVSRLLHDLLSFSDLGCWTVDD